MFKYTKLLLLIGATATLGLSGCAKKCDLPEDTNSGAIIKDVIIYPESGYLMANLTQDQYLITEGHTYENRFEVSFDGGHSKVPLNHSSYAILAYPMTVSCNASFSKEVTIDHANNFILYTIKATECSNCKEQRVFENYVLIPDVPSSYTVLFDVDIQTK